MGRRSLTVKLNCSKTSKTFKKYSSRIVNEYLLSSSFSLKRPPLRYGAKTSAPFICCGKCLYPRFSWLYPKIAKVQSLDYIGSC